MKRVLAAGLCRIYQIVRAFETKSMASTIAGDSMVGGTEQTRTALMDDVQALIRSAADVRVTPPLLTDGVSQIWADLDLGA